MKRIGPVLIGLALVATLVMIHRASRRGERREGAPAIRATPVDQRPSGDSVSLLPAQELESTRVSRALIEQSAASIRGKVVLPDGSPAQAGFAFAWPVGLRPGPEAFENPGSPAGSSPVFSSPIQPDGSFHLDGLSALEDYTLSAVAPGAACPVRPSGVRPGREGVEIQLMFLYGVAIGTRDVDGRPPRTSAAFFGRGPHASGPGEKLVEIPPELHALGIVGLERGHGTRDRWQYLVVTDTPTREVGPIDYRIAVPGYRPKHALLQAFPVVDRLEEIFVTLEPEASEWGEVAVRLHCARQVLDLGLRDDEYVGSVALVPGNDPQGEEIRFAISERALLANEAIGTLPTAGYEARFVAEDSYFETNPTKVEIVRGKNQLEFDLSLAGTLLMDVREGNAPYDGRFVTRVDFPNGILFYSTFDSGPYVIPFLHPGTYQLSEVEVSGKGCAPEPATEFTILSGQISVELVACQADTER